MGWFLLGTVWLVGVAFFGRAWRRRLIQQRLRRGLTAGSGRAVTIVGRIVDTDRLVESPLSTKKGVLIVTTAELPELDEESLPVELTSTRAVPFYLDTVQHGLVRVEGTAFETAMRGTTPKPRDRKREEEFMVAHGRGATAALAATFREIVLVPGQHVAIYGDALVEEDHQAERGYRDNAPLRMKIVGPEGQQLAFGEPPLP